MRTLLASLVLTLLATSAAAKDVSIEELRQIGFASAAVGTCDNIEYIDHPSTEEHVNQIYILATSDQFASINSGEAEFEELAESSLSAACVAATIKFRQLLRLKNEQLD
jgi:hypothetical protein